MTPVSNISIQVVTSCCDCPFRVDGGADSFCGPVDMKIDLIAIMPTDCPLRTSAVLVQKKSE